MDGTYTVDEAAAHFNIDGDTLHRFYKQQIRARNFAEDEFDSDDHGQGENRVEALDIEAEDERGEKVPKREFRPIEEDERGTFSDNWEKAQESTEDEGLLFTPLADSLSRIPVLKWLVRKGEVSLKALFEMAAVLAVIILLTFFIPLLKKNPADDAPPISNAHSPPAHNLPIEEAKMAIRKFLDAPDAKARLKFVREPERVGPLMQAWNSKHPLDAGVLNYKYIFFDEQQTQFEKTYLKYSVTDDVNDSPRPITVISEAGKDGPVCRVDWEEFVVYQPGGWDYFLESRSTDEHTFRVEAAFSDYYNYGYTDEQQYISLLLSVPGETAQIYVFLDRTKDLTSKIGEALISQKQVSSKFKLMLKLTFADIDPKERDVVRVTEMISPSWLTP